MKRQQLFGGMKHEWRVRRSIKVFKCIRRRTMDVVALKNGENGDNEGCFFFQNELWVAHMRDE